MLLQTSTMSCSQKDGVEGGREGLAVPGRGAAGKDDCVVLVAFGGVEGNAGQVKGLEDVGPDELVSKGEADGVKGGEGRGALQGEHGHAALSHEGAHILPGQVGALAAHALLRVDGVVEDGEAHVGLPDLVGVRVDHAEVEGTVLLLAGITMMGYGVIRGEAAVVLGKAIKLCLECVGIG